MSVLDDIDLSEIDRAKLIEDRDKIIEWITNNILPWVVNHNEYICILYYVYDKDKDLRRALYIHVCPERGILFGTEYAPLNKIDTLSKIYGLINNWEGIKKELRATLKHKNKKEKDRLKEQKKIINKIRNFRC